MSEEGKYWLFKFWISCVFYTRWEKKEKKYIKKINITIFTCQSSVINISDILYNSSSGAQRHSVLSSPAQGQLLPLEIPSSSGPLWPRHWLSRLCGPRGSSTTAPAHFLFHYGCATRSKENQIRTVFRAMFRCDYLLYFSAYLKLLDLTYCIRELYYCGKWY